MSDEQQAGHETRDQRAARDRRFRVPGQRRGPLAVPGDRAHAAAVRRRDRGRAQREQRGRRPAVAVGDGKRRAAPRAVPEFVAAGVQDDGHPGLGGVAHERAVDLRRQPGGQAAAQHDRRRVRQQPPVAGREPPQLLGRDVRPGLAQAQHPPGALLPDPQHPARFPPDHRELRGYPGARRVGPDQLTGGPARQPGRQHVMPELVQHPGDGDTPPSPGTGHGTRR